jgi:hypothetical protein
MDGLHQLTNMAVKTTHLLRILCHARGYLCILSPALSNFRADTIASHPHPLGVADGLTYDLTLLIVSTSSLLFYLSSNSLQIN